jgi:hypothetical protein
MVSDQRQLGQQRVQGKNKIKRFYFKPYGEGAESVFCKNMQ